MQKMADNIWILSNLDLKICMQALGYKGEMDFPVMQRESSLSERIASSVVKLNQMGFLYLEENGYQPTEQLREFFRNYKFRSETESAEKRKYADCVL